MSMSSRHTAALLRELADMIEQDKAVVFEIHDVVQPPALLSGGSRPEMMWVSRTLDMKIGIRPEGKQA